MPAKLSARDKLILETAALRVSWLVVAPLHTLFGFNSSETFRKRLDVLVKEALLLRRQVVCRLPSAVNAPVFAYSPGDSVAEATLSKLAYLLQTRWNGHSPRRVSLYRASPKLLALFGVGSRASKEDSHASHDVFLTYVFAWYAERNPHHAKEFFHERYAEAFSVRGFGEVHPDAYLMTDGKPEKVYRVIEAGGVYDKARVTRLVEDSSARNLPLEIW